jgi:ATP-dependent RNA helicase DDX51/DBP6
LTKHPQKLLFSATLTRNPEKINALKLNNPIYACIQSESEKRYKTPANLSEKMIITTTASEKISQLINLLIQNESSSFLIFTKSIQASIRLTMLLNFFSDLRCKSNIHAVTFQSSVPFKERSKILNDFNNEKSKIIVTTDLSSRGLDLQIDFVINYDLPSSVKTYIHRVGRTARANQSGTSITILDKSQAKWFKSQNVKNENIQRSGKVKKMAIVATKVLIRML